MNENAPAIKGPAPNSLRPAVKPYADVVKFCYSSGTIAQKKFPDNIPEAIKTERIVRLIEIQKEITYQTPLV